jgi:hypothetical protein
VRADTSPWLSVGCSSDSRDWLTAMIELAYNFYFLFVVIVYFTKKLLLRNINIFSSILNTLTSISCLYY